MEYSKEDLMEAKRQIDSTLHKLRETIITFEAKETPERYKSQITLAKRRIRAFEIANYFIENEIENSQKIQNKCIFGVGIRFECFNINRKNHNLKRKIIFKKH